MLTFGSLFSGCGTFDLGLERAGLTCAWQCEADATCRDVLAKHWPDVYCYTDVRKVDASAARVDLLCGGWPCQDLSVAGKRAGLAGARSGLFHEFVRVARQLRPRWILGENVPGLLSSHGGRDMATVVESLGQLGYFVAWRVLDAQYFGVAQRRRRVFVVASLGDASCVEILFEPDCLPGDSAPGREAGTDIAASLTRGSASGGGVNQPPGRRREDDVNIVVAHALTSCKSASGPQGKGWQKDKAFTMEARTKPQAIAYRTSGNSGVTEQGDLTAALNCATDPTQNIVTTHALTRRHDSSEDGCGRSTPLVPDRLGVRRLTPRECERLQGLPDDWTRHGASGKEISDSRRYQMIGNAGAVPVLEWIGRRVAAGELTRAKGA